MKVLYFSLLGFALSFVSVSAQGREGRRDSNEKENSRYIQHQQGRRGENENQPNRRFENNRPHRNENRREDYSDKKRWDNSRKETVFNNSRKAPIRIKNNGQNYSYRNSVNESKIRGFEHYHFNKANFYGRNGIYYKPFNKGYVRFMPPVGFNINILPTAAITINIGSNPYYFYEGVYYKRSNRHYQVVEPPLGAFVYALPMGYERVNHRGQLYYEFAGVLYEKVYYRGEQGYQVVGFLS